MTGAPEFDFEFDWDEIEAVSKCVFEYPLRQEIKENFDCYRLKSGDYADEVKPQHYLDALLALGALSKGELARLRLEPIEDELDRVQWFLDVMSHQDVEEKEVGLRYFLYSRIWKLLAATGLNMTRGNGDLESPLSHAQKVFQEVCRQAGFVHKTDAGLAKMLKRALKFTGTK